MKTMFCRFPYDNDSLYAIRTNDDGTFSMRTLIGSYDDEYGPQKRRFDLRQSKPYITTDDYGQVTKTLEKIRAMRIGHDLESVGFNYYWFDGQICANRKFVQAGYNEKQLYIITVKERDPDDPIDCKVAVINLCEREKNVPWSKEPVISPIGGWSWHRYEEMKCLNENAVTLIDRSTAIKMATKVFIEKWENKLADFEEWCGVGE